LSGILDPLTEYTPSEKDDKRRKLPEDDSDDEDYYDAYDYLFEGEELVELSQLK
jgi:hypothetical protein